MRANATFGFLRSHLKTALVVVVNVRRILELRKVSLGSIQEQIDLSLDVV